MIEIAGEEAASLIPMLTIGNYQQNAISLYFHVPFCKKKCDYCHFYVIPDKAPFKALLMEGFVWEWERWADKIQGKNLVSIYFGGGTPSLLGPHLILDILDLVNKTLPFDNQSIEITLEANPETFDAALIKAYADAGINRLSIGIQTLDNQLLQILGREHDAKVAWDAVITAYDAGIRNLSIDLMYDLPKQTLKSWEDTLKQASTLPITHLSLYNLTIEPHTVFFKYKNSLEKMLPNEEQSLRMHEKAIEVLERAGIAQYEISAFAKNGLYSRHNVGYWIGRPFLGFGPSAFSYFNHQRFRNIAHLHRYHAKLKSKESPIDFEETLDENARIRELLVIRLRLLEGVDLAAFEEHFGKLSSSIHEDLLRCHELGLISIEGNLVKLSSKGRLFYDTLAEEVI